MTSYIYMNHYIYDKKNHKSKTPEPVITVQTGSKRIYCNEVAIKGTVIIKCGTLQALGHNVHGWLETDSPVEVLG